MEVEANIPLPDAILYLSGIFKREGHLLYLVGGAVRDHLMGEEAKDYDVATDAEPQKVGAMLTRAGVRNFPKGEAFGVWVAHLNGEDYEIATFREDLGTADGRRPESVRWASPAADARRRDLTINALFYEIPTHDTEPGKVIDFFDGQALEDVRTRTIRVVGDPYERFGEDRLRILRIPRFHARFSDKEIELDKRTLQAIEHYKEIRSPGVYRGTQLEPVSGERIQKEFESGLAKCKNLGSFIRTYEKLDLLDQVFPFLHIDVRTADRLANSKNTNVVLAFLLRRNRAEKVREHLNRLNWPNTVTDEVAFLLRVTEAVQTDADASVLVGHAHHMHRKPHRYNDMLEFGQALGSEVDSDVWGHLMLYSPVVYSGEQVMKMYNIETPGPEIGRRQKELHAGHFHTSYLFYIDAK
jgi:tRNA nucleotidyltransferase/poly(A) polymerase